jgi:quercetin dioxygenase-like cupin family protein
MPHQKPAIQKNNPDERSLSDIGGQLRTAREPAWECSASKHQDTAGHLLRQAKMGVVMNTDQFFRLQREPLLEASVPAANPPVTMVKGARIRFAPGQPTGLHQHPISTVGIVTEGSFNFQLQGEPARLLRKGDCFFEPVGHTVLIFDNASASEAAEIVCFYLTDSNDRPPIEMLEGGMDAQLGRKS